MNKQTLNQIYELIEEAQGHLSWIDADDCHSVMIGKEDASAKLYEARRLLEDEMSVDDMFELCRKNLHEMMQNDYKTDSLERSIEAELGIT